MRLPTAGTTKEAATTVSLHRDTETVLNLPSTSMRERYMVKTRAVASQSRAEQRECTTVYKGGAHAPRLDTLLEGLVSETGTRQAS